MGWTTTNRHGQPIKEFIKDQIECSNDSGTWEVLDIAIVKLKTAYIACKITRPNQKPYVCCLVFLLEYNCWDGHDIGYKDMDEGMGPCECECPERILKQLSSIEEVEGTTGRSASYAAEWRKKCWDNIARKKLMRKGAKIKFEPGMKFSDGRVRDQFEVLGHGKFLSIPDYTTVKISGHALQRAIVI